MVPDPAAAQAFYAGLFGWEFAAGAGSYTVGRVGGLDVAGVGAFDRPSWNTYIRVESVEAALERASAAGAKVLLGATDMPPAGRAAALLDPAGAAVLLWEPGKLVGARRINEPNTWTMSSLHVTSTDTAVAFYGAVFGWQPEPFGPLTLFRLPGYVGGEEGQPIPRDVIAAMAAPDPNVPAHWNVNFRVSDADAIAARAAELGGSVLAGPFDTPGFRNAVIADPQGATFSISQLVLG
jgi:predicted enzyme related to lactoylglutathione lyase